MRDELGFTVIRIVDGHDEVIARASNLRVARGAYEAAAKEFSKDKLELRTGAHVNARNWTIKPVKITLMKPANAAAREVPGALLTDHMGKVVAGWEVMEPALRRLLEARGFAYFEVENPPGTDEWTIVEQVKDQDW